MLGTVVLSVYSSLHARTPSRPGHYGQCSKHAGNTALTLGVCLIIRTGLHTLPPYGWLILKADAKNPFAHCLSIFYIIF